LGFEEVRSEFVANSLDPWQPFRKQFDPRRIVPTVKDKARIRRLHGSGVDPDLIFAIPILSPYDESKMLTDDFRYAPTSRLANSSSGHGELQRPADRPRGG
jgi:hypothetical protein